MKHYLLALALICFGSTSYAGSMPISGENPGGGSVDGTAISPTSVSAATITLTGQLLVNGGPSGGLGLKVSSETVVIDGTNAKLTIAHDTSDRFIFDPVNQQITGTGNWFFDIPNAAGNYRFQVDNDTKLYLNSTGLSVGGAGTASAASYPLQVTGTILASNNVHMGGFTTLGLLGAGDAMVLGIGAPTSNGVMTVNSRETNGLKVCATASCSVGALNVVATTGRVGLGVAAPGYPLEMVTGPVVIDDASNIILSSATTAANTTLGRVIGHSYGSKNPLFSGAEIEFRSGTSGELGEIAFLTNNNNSTINRALERARITSSGLFGIGTASPCSTCTLHVSGTGNFTGALRQGSVVSCATGVQTDADGLFSACAASDLSLKRDIKSISYKGNIDALRPVSYRWRNISARDDREHMGFIAQEVQKVYPAAVVSAGKDLIGIDSNALIAQLVLELQDVRKRLAKLEKKK